MIRRFQSWLIVPLLLAFCGQAASLGAKRARVQVYVLDNGIRADHRELRGLLGEGFDGDREPARYGDHATMLAGLIAGKRSGISRRAVLHSVDILSDEGEGQWLSLLAGIEWVAAHRKPGGPAIANVSLGGAPNHLIAALVEAAIEKLVDAGICVVVAAGNENVDDLQRVPSRIPEVIAVGAVTRDYRKLAVSNFGGCADLYAVGDNLRGPISTGKSAYGTASGTSLAAAVVTGYLANYLSEHPDSSPAVAKRFLMSQCEEGRIEGLPAGSANRLLVVEGLP